jgi:hypothetical protein
MWWLLIVITLAAAWLLAVLLDFIPPPHAKILIKIHEGQFKVTRGQLRAQPREFISDMLQEAGIARGHIAVTYYNRAAFSRNIPGNIRQRLRNVLLNTP